MARSERLCRSSASASSMLARWPHQGSRAATQGLSIGAVARMATLHGNAERLRRPRLPPAMRVGDEMRALLSDTRIEPRTQTRNHIREHGGARAITHTRTNPQRDEHTHTHAYADARAHPP
eukprot:120408-Pleurochrysis_carterae.AAC.3